MNAGQVNGWWVVAIAAILIAFDLAASPAVQTTAFFQFTVLCAPTVLLFWWIGRD